MMEFQLFMEAAADAARRVLGEGSTVERDTIRTRGGKSCPVLRIMQENDGKKEELLLFLDELYGEFKDGAPLPELLESHSAAAGKKSLMGEVLDLSGELPEGLPSRWEAVKDKVYPLLLPQGRLPGIPERPAPFRGCGVSVVCAVRMEAEAGIQRRPTAVTPSMVRKLGITQDVLYRTAKKNLENDGCHAMWLAGQVFAAMNEEEDEQESVPGMLEPGEQYVLSNRPACWGAAALLHEELMKRLSGGRDMYILPSSVHEVILIVDDGSHKQEEFDSLVRMVNKDGVALQDRLGDGSFFYDGKTGEIRRYRNEKADMEAVSPDDGK